MFHLWKKIQNGIMLFLIKEYEIAIKELKMKSKKIDIMTAFLIGDFLFCKKIKVFLLLQIMEHGHYLNIKQAPKSISKYWHK